MRATPGSVGELADELGVGVDAQEVPRDRSGSRGQTRRGGGGVGVGEACGRQCGLELVGVAGADLGAGRGEQVGLGAVGDDAAVPDDDEVVGDDFDLVEQVGGQQHGGAAVGVPAQQVAHPADAGGVQARWRARRG